MPGFPQKALGGLGRDCSLRRWEVHNGEKDWGREGPHSWSALAFAFEKLLEAYKTISQLFPTAVTIRRKRCGNV